MYSIWEMRLSQLWDATDLGIVFHTHSHFKNKLNGKGCWFKKKLLFKISFFSFVKIIGSLFLVSTLPKYWVLRGKESTELKIWAPYIHEKFKLEYLYPKSLRQNLSNLRRQVLSNSLRQDFSISWRHFVSISMRQYLSISLIPLGAISALPPFSAGRWPPYSAGSSCQHSLHY